MEAQARPGPDRNLLLLIAGGLALIGFGVFRGNIAVSSLIVFAVAIPSIILHEVSHGAAALTFGDTTAKQAGRLTLNPIKHVDAFGTIILPALLALANQPAFGYAKPVPVNPRRMRSPRNHSLLTSLAGPATNIVLALVGLVLFNVLRDAIPDLFTKGGETSIGAALFWFGGVNVALAVFNLIPLPPLDGSAVVERFMPASWWPRYLWLRQYSMLIVIGIFLLAPQVLDAVMNPVIDRYYDLML